LKIVGIDQPEAQHLLFQIIWATGQEF